MIDLTCSRTFFHSNSFLATDQGNHFGYTTHCPKLSEEMPPSCWHISRLVLFHYHVKSYSHFVSKVLSRSNAYGFTNSTTCETVPAGQHYCLRAQQILALNEEHRYDYYHGISCQINSPVVTSDMIYQKYCHTNSLH